MKKLEESRKHTSVDDVRKEDPYSQIVKEENIQGPMTVSSYRGIFNRMGLPIPRSARVKVDYDLIHKDPKITEQLKQIVKFKSIKGK